MPRRPIYRIKSLPLSPEPRTCATVIAFSPYFDPLTKLIFAVAAVLGLVGGVRVYSKFNSGDPDASKSATALFLSCVFLVIVGTVLRSFFL